MGYSLVSLGVGALSEHSVSESEWHLARGGKEYGPITDRELFRLAEQGTLQPDDLLWKRGFEDLLARFPVC